MIRLDQIENGIAYRIPPPGAVIENGLLKANIAYPGLDIRYTTDGSDPTMVSRLYEYPVSVNSSVKLRALGGGGAVIARRIWRRFKMKSGCQMKPRKW